MIAHKICDNDNNRVWVAGQLVSGFEYSYEAYGKRYYTSTLKVTRLSDEVDYIPIMATEYLARKHSDCTGQTICVIGQFRSYNWHLTGENRLRLCVFAKEIEPMGIFKIGGRENNEIWLDGFLCKPPVYRKTPLGREITELTVAVNRSYQKSDYIPCICWNRNARTASVLPVGAHIQIYGRIQSRKYTKRLEGTEEKRITYEVSVYKIIG